VAVTMPRTAQHRRLPGQAGWLYVDLGEQSRTGFGPSWSSSRTQMRTEWPSIRKNPALAWYSGTGIGRPLGTAYPSRNTELKPLQAGKGTG
jgi:hypothetical protein